MDRRKSVLDEYEEVTLDLLQEAAAKYDAVVYPKVRLADALAIDGSGLSSEEFSYALRCHFDFVVARRPAKAQFAVEFDGARHAKDPVTIRRDALKEAVCAKLEMPLLRIDSSFFRRIDRFSIVGWLTELWFLNEEFAEAQERGEIPPDEPFLYFSILADMSAPTVPFPFDPSINARAQLQRWGRAGKCDYPPEHLFARDPSGHWISVLITRMAPEKYAIGVGRCRAFRFPPVAPLELSEDLAVIDACEKVRASLAGEAQPSSEGDAQQWRVRVRRWRGESG